MSNGITDQMRERIAATLAESKDIAGPIPIKDMNGYYVSLKNDAPVTMRFLFSVSIDHEEVYVYLKI